MTSFCFEQYPVNNCRLTYNAKRHDDAVDANDPLVERRPDVRLLVDDALKDGFNFVVGAVGAEPEADAEAPLGRRVAVQVRVDGDHAAQAHEAPAQHHR